MRDHLPSDPDHPSRPRGRRSPGPTGLRGITAPSVAALLLGLLWAGPAPGATQPKVKVALHVRPHVAKAIVACLPAGEGGTAPTDLPCAHFEPYGGLLTGYDVYLVAAGGDPFYGILGMACGVGYDGAPAKGVDVFGWTLCADLDLHSQGGSGRWPESGGGNQILWLPGNCQTGTVPGYPDAGVQAVAGSFYVYAYGADTLRITEEIAGYRRQFAVVDCANRTTELQYAAMGSAVFTSGTAVKGCNPCLEPCAPEPECSVEPLSFDFGDVPIGESREAVFTVRNRGQGRLRGYVGAGCFFDFKVEAGGGGYVLAPGESRKVSVRFQPIFRVVRECRISLANVCPEITLTGRAVDPPDPEHLRIVRLLSGSGDRSQRLQYRIPSGVPASVAVYDVAGRRVRELEVAGRSGAGVVEWDASGLPAGVYFYRLEWTGGRAARKFVLVR